MRSNRGTWFRAVAAAAILPAGMALAGCAGTTNGSGRANPPQPSTSEPAIPSRSPSSTPPVTSVPPPTPTSPAVPTETIHPAPSTPLRTVRVSAVDGTTYVVKIWADVENDTCFDHAYGTAIVTFLTQHPCTGLRRYLATTRVDGRPVGFNESSTGFAGTAKKPYQEASRFAALEQQDGTGSLNDLLREGYRLPSGPTSVPSPDAFNVLGQDQGVTVWDAWYLDGPTPYNDPALITMTQDLFLQF